jgi:hypothetical protein
MSDEFGDVEEDDVWVEEAVDPDPNQVTLRFHENRQEMAAFANERVPDWGDLEPEEQEIALALGEGLVEQILIDIHGLTAAEWLHNARAYMSSGEVPGWNELEDDDKDVAESFVILILDWLQREGTIQ